MNPDPVTNKKLLRVLVLGFSAVIVLLVAAAFVGVNSAQLIKESTAELVRSELVTTRLIDELQREQDTLNATFYKLSRGPELLDRERVLAQLDAADQVVGRIVQEAADEHEVTLLGTDIDHDGGKLILVAGVPRRIGDDEERVDVPSGVRTALALSRLWLRRC